MEKNREAYLNYVCPYCWNTLDNCICDLFPPYTLIFIDKNIQDHIRILNEKRYFTTGCCEGHRKVCINTYISFPDDYFNEIPMPDGFKYDKKRRMITYNYSPKLSDVLFEELKSKKLAILLEWCKNLPTRK